jgi:hypothetical protein
MFTNEDSHNVFNYLNFAFVSTSAEKLEVCELAEDATSTKSTKSPIDRLLNEEIGFHCILRSLDIEYAKLVVRHCARGYTQQMIPVQTVQANLSASIWRHSFTKRLIGGYI